MEIKPGGACFYPDTVISHASFAFNSYWQRERDSGGSCDFGGAAVVVSSDPSNTNYIFFFQNNWNLRNFINFLLWF